MQVKKRNMIGMDVSHHNTYFHKKELRCWDFEIHKLSEGTAYVDPTVKEWWKTRDGDTLNGVYHYLNNGDTEGQVFNAINLLQGLNMAGKVMFVIDYEDISLKPSLKEGVLKLIDFIERFKIFYPSYQPVIYCNKTARSSITRWCANDIWRHWCLWLADYSDNGVSHEDIWEPMMRQWTNNPFDLDVFFGSPSSWRAFYKLF